MVPLPEEVVVLLVDDSEDDLFIIERAIGKADLRNRIVKLSDGEEALAYFGGVGKYADREKYPVPGLVLLDLKMPKVDGFEVLSSIRQQPAYRDLPVIVLTSSELLMDVRRAYEVGASSYLVKPLEFQNLAAMVRTLGAVWRQATERRGAAGASGTGMQSGG